MDFDATDTWEALFSKQYMRWFHLQGQPALCEIVKVEKDVELTMRGGVKSKKPVMHLKQIKGHIEDVLPLVLNVTNGASIAAIHGSKPSQWAGKQIVLFPSSTKMFDAEQKKMLECGCIRIRAPKT